MATPKPSKDLVSLTNPQLTKELLQERNHFLINQFVSPLKFKPKSNTHWEEITCVGYNPQTQRLEAVVSIKQSAGYSGGLCGPSSFEYVRFFVDFKDGGGYRDMGLASFKRRQI